MSTYTDHEQRLLDQQSGAELDRLAERRALKLIDHVIDVMHKPPEKAREHEEAGTCWCNPTLDFTNPETGAKHWIHHEPN